MPHPIRDGGANGQPAAAFTVEAPDLRAGRSRHVRRILERRSERRPRRAPLPLGPRRRRFLGHATPPRSRDPLGNADAGVLALSASRPGTGSASSRRRHAGVDIPVPDSQRLGGPTVPLFAIQQQWPTRRSKPSALSSGWRIRRRTGRCNRPRDGTTRPRGPFRRGTAGATGVFSRRGTPCRLAAEERSGTGEYGWRRHRDRRAIGCRPCIDCPHVRPAGRRRRAMVGC